ncbi:bcl-2-associated transcription factor 1 isoform X1 [Arapaima gigas]
MVRSKSHSRSSKSRSRSRSSSRSRSRSRSRKKRYSSRSRSRSHSHSRSRDRNYPREYRRDFRPSRGMRRPYGFRNRGRGFFQGAGRFHHRGGFRSNWQNRRYSRSPRRGRSRSRTPKHKSTSQRSRSKSARSGRSSASHHSSPSSSSPSPPRRYGNQEKSSRRPECSREDVQPPASEGVTIQSSSAALPLPQIEPKRPTLLSDSWTGISGYEDNSPPHSPPSQGSSHSNSQTRPTVPQGNAPQAPQGLSSAPSSRVLLPQSDEQEPSKMGKYFKRYLEETSERTTLQEKEDGRGIPTKDRLQERVQWGGLDIDLGVKRKGEKVPFLGHSPEPEEDDESQAYRQPHQFKVSSQAELNKGSSVELPWSQDHLEEPGRCKSHAPKGVKELERAHKFQDSNILLSTIRYNEQAEGLQQYVAKRESMPLLYKIPLEGRTENAPRAGPSHGGRPQVKMKMESLECEDASPGLSVVGDRSLASVLASSSRKEQTFRSIFHHIMQPQAPQSSAEAFVHHIVSLVHYVRERYFEPPALSLHERFTVYQTAGVEHEATHRSPEIHRRIDVSPTAFKKSRIFKEDPKDEKKSRCGSTDLRYDIDRSHDREETRVTREASPPRKGEKLGKEFKDHKDYKPFKDDSKHKSKDRGNSRCSSRASSRSSGSHEDGRDRRRAREEPGKAPAEQKVCPGPQGAMRPRGTLQFRIRGGRGRGRGAVPPAIPFQKRPKEEEWDPEYTPKSRKYFLHDDRDDGTDYWAKRGRGRGVFQRGRGRFPFRKSMSSPKWTHDKYQCEGNEELEEEDHIECEERKDALKEEKVE